MTTDYEKFQAGRREFPDGSFLYNYGNATLTINANTEYPWYGKYLLAIDRDEWVSDDLEQLESKLWVWAQENL